MSGNSDESHSLAAYFADQDAGERTPDQWRKLLGHSDIVELEPGHSYDFFSGRRFPPKDYPEDWDDFQGSTGHSPAGVSYIAPVPIKRAPPKIVSKAKRLWTR